MDLVNNKEISEKILAQGKRTLEIEAQSILSLKKWVDHSFVEAVNLILACKGKLILTGMGKSGQIARKIASTFASTGTPALFLHPAESSHGDIGIVDTADVVMALSYSGETAELKLIIEYCTRKGIPVIGMAGNSESLLGKSSRVFVCAKVAEEACPLGLAPTASSTAMLAMGDALAMATLDARGFKPEAFAERHPGGSLGFRLLKRVKDFMHQGEGLPFARLNTPMKDVFALMTHRDVRGVVGVLNDQEHLVGVITDGDIRRRLEKDENPMRGTASEMMMSSPRTIDANELAEKALFFMEQFRIQHLFVTDQKSQDPLKPVGIIHFFDLLNAKVR